MMRYYFDLRDDGTLREDPEGSEFANLEEACAEAAVAAREMMADALRRGEPIDGKVFEIRQEGVGVVATLPFDEAIPTRLD